MISVILNRTFLIENEYYSTIYTPNKIDYRKTIEINNLMKAHKLTDALYNLFCQMAVTRSVYNISILPIPADVLNKDIIYIYSNQRQFGYLLQNRNYQELYSSLGINRMRKSDVLGCFLNFIFKYSELIENKLKFFYDKNQLYNKYVIGIHARTGIVEG
jgi:hypothetical protein